MNEFRHGRNPIRASSYRTTAARALLLLALCVTALLASSAVQAATVRFPAKTCRYWAPVYMPIIVSPGTGVTSMDFTFTYDSAVLTARAVYRTPLTTAYSLSYNVSTPGVVTVHLAGAAALSGSGDVAWVKFDPVDPVGGSGTSSAVTWVSSSLNGGAIPSSMVNGSISLITPGTVISVPDSMQGTPGSNVIVVVSATAFTGGDSFDIDLEFDPGVVTATLVEKGAVTQPLTLAYNVSTPGIVRIALFGTQSVNGPGDLVKITFHVQGALGSQTPIDITRANINEGAIPTTLGPGLFTVCTGADGDGDSYSACAGDCNDANPNVHPGAAELCNGIDDNCDGTTDNAPAPLATHGLTVAPQGASWRLTWSALAGATSYDVVRGSLGLLATSHGNFTSATQACTANNLAATTLLDATAAPTGGGIWYLVRGSNCGGAGTYDSGALSQSGSRDAEIQASAGACP